MIHYIIKDYYGCYCNEGAFENDTYIITKIKEEAIIYAAKDIEEIQYRLKKLNELYPRPKRVLPFTYEIVDMQIGIYAYNNVGVIHKYKMGDFFWMMRDNKPVQFVITDVYIHLHNKYTEIDYAGYIENTNKLLIIFSEKHIEINMFKTKKELLDSL